jgi:hypothetical protein
MAERRRRHTAADRLREIDVEIAQILEAFPDLRVYRGASRQTTAPLCRTFSRPHGPRPEGWRLPGQLKQRAH